MKKKSTRNTIEADRLGSFFLEKLEVLSAKAAKIGYKCRKDSWKKFRNRNIIWWCCSFKEP